MVKFWSRQSLSVNGVISASGTSDSPIMFTSAAATAAAGDWGRILLNGGSASGSFDHVQIEYAGYSNHFGVRVLGNATLQLSNSVLSDIIGRAVVLDGGESTLIDHQIRDVTGFAVDVAQSVNSVNSVTMTNTAIERAAAGAYRFHPSANLTASGTTSSDSGMADGILVTSGEIYGPRTWQGDLPYRLDESLRIAFGGSLDVGPGTIVKADPGVQIRVEGNGSLSALGTPGEPIIFTSINPNDQIRIQYTVLNAGTVDVTGEWTDELYLRAGDNPFSENDWAVIANDEPIAAGAQRTSEYTLSVPAVPSANLFWRIQLDASNDVAETIEGESNNTSEASNVITVNWPDLTVGSTVGGSFSGSSGESVVKLRAV